MKNLLYRQNQSNLRNLEEFLGYINDYVTEIDKGNIENAQQYRNLISLKGPKIHDIFSLAGVSSTINYGSQMSGYSVRSLILDVPFFVKEYIDSKDFGSISGNVLPNIQDRFLMVIGKYEDNKNQSIINTLNPFFYLRKLSIWILKPVIDLFKTNSDNFIIKLISIAIEGIIILGAIRPILQDLQYTQNIINFIKSLT